MLGFLPFHLLGALEDDSLSIGSRKGLICEVRVSGLNAMTKPSEHDLDSYEMYQELEIHGQIIPESDGEPILVGIVGHHGLDITCPLRYGWIDFSLR